MYVHTQYIYIYICIYIYISHYMYVDIYIYTSHIQIYLSTLHTCVCIHTCIATQTCIQSYIHTYIHTYIHIHTKKKTSLRNRGGKREKKTGRGKKKSCPVPRLWRQCRRRARGAWPPCSSVRVHLRASGASGLAPSSTRTAHRCPCRRRWP